MAHGAHSGHPSTGEWGKGQSSPTCIAFALAFLLMHFLVVCWQDQATLHQANNKPGQWHLGLGSILPSSEQGEWDIGRACTAM